MPYIGCDLLYITEWYTESYKQDNITDISSAYCTTVYYCNYILHQVKYMREANLEFKLINVA